jgi:hypothetical protein
MKYSDRILRYINKVAFGLCIIYIIVYYLFDLDKSDAFSGMFTIILLSILLFVALITELLKRKIK